MTRTPARPSSARIRWTTAVVVAALTGLTLAGCSGSDSSAGASGSQTLTIASSTEPGSFDPTKDSNGGVQTWFQELAYEPLIDINAAGKYIPGLATKWGYVAGEGGKEFSLTIRQGAKFADGTAVTPKAVANSINFFVKNASGPSAGSFAGIKATTQGSDGVLLTSATPNPIIEDLLTANNYGGNIISPAGIADPTKLAGATYGAGPYVYQPSQSVSGSYYTYTPNKNFYDQSTIHFKKIVIKVLSNSTSALQALKTGQVDIMAGDPTTVAAAKSAKLKVASANVAFYGFFDLDWAGKLQPALGKLKVRQAMEMAVDRASITKAIFGDYGTPTVQPNTPGWDAYDPALEKLYPYDVAKAKSLLASAGYPNGFSMKMLYTAFDATDTKLVQAVVSQLGAIGIKVNLTPVQNFSEFDADNATKQYSAVSLGWGGQTQFVNTNQLWTAQAALNPWKNEVAGLPAAFATYEASTDANIDANARAVEKIIVDQAVSEPISQIAALTYYTPKLKGFALTPNGLSTNPDTWTLSK